MANEAFAPGVWSTKHIDGVSSILATGDLVELWYLVAVNILLDLFGDPMCLFVSVADLTIGVESPYVEISFLGQGSCVTVASRAALDFGLLSFLVWRKFDKLRHSDLSVFVAAELTHTSLTPAPHLTIVCYGE